MSKDKQTYPGCFGVLEEVFPQGKYGLRATPEKCLRCIHKTSCLRTAMQGVDGLQVKEESIDRAYRAGVIGFLERWSRKKDLRRRRKTHLKKLGGH